ncbi:MAG: response regulator [Alkalispirochaeta sp.]
MIRFISALHYGAVLVDAQGRVITINDHLARMCGIDGDTFRARPIDDLLTTVLSEKSPWRPSGRWQEDREILEAGPVHAFIPGPRPRDVSISVAPGRRGRAMVTFVASADGGRSGVVDALLRTTSAGVFVLDSDGRILTHNTLARQLGPEDDGTLPAGFPWMSSIDDYLNVTQKGVPFQIRERITRARRQNRDLTFAADLRAAPTPDRELDVAISIAPIEHVLADASQEAISAPPLDTAEAVVVCVRDISDRKQLSRDIRHLQHAREVSRAAGGIAHELSNSTTALMTHLGLLVRSLRDTPAVVGDELKNAESAVRRIRRLGQQLERFSGHGSADSDQEDSETGAEVSGVLLSEIIQDTVALAVSGTGVRSSFAIDGGLPSVRIPSEAISQALFNVVINAVEAMDEEGLIHFSVWKSDDPDAVVVEVRDEGHGMDNRIVSQVTQPYFSTKPHGVGMGLTVTLSTLENFGGGLEIETDPGFGTAVRMYLPSLETLPEGMTAARTQEVDTQDFRGARVLLVEDDPLVRRSLERTLQSVGCEVTAVESGDRAIEVFRSEIAHHQQFQLVITDLTMPGRNDGVQLLRRIRELDPLIPAVLSSGALHRRNASSYRDAGFQYVLRKPFGESEVRFALSVALSR